MRPLIGLTTYGDLARYGSNDLYSALLPMAYVRSVNESGGRAVLIPEDGPDSDGAGSDLMDSLDGIIFTGGGDVTPSYYGADPDPQTVAVPTRDASEWPLMQAALAADLPLLAICRGMQLMVAAYGGTLRQHLPDVLGNDDHRSLTEARYTTHVVRFASGSIIHGLLGDEAIVNSRHHQGIADPGRLTATGWVPDGSELIEAVEDPLLRFAVGVQWHPEDMTDRRLFAALVEAASRPAA
jgi:putative glutamine amidotransferase